MSVGITLALICGATVNLGAQQTHVAAEFPTSSNSKQSEVVFTRPVTVQIDRMLLPQAVQLLGERANVLIQYQREVLAAFPVMVSLHAERMTLGQALALLLKGTNLEAIASAEDAVTIRAARKNTIAQGVIVGRIINGKTRKPIPGIKVILDDAQQSVQVAEDGTFRIPTVAGEHILRVRGVGFLRQERKVTVTEGASLNLEFALEPGASVLDEVIVTGTVIATERKAIPTPITVISASEIERRGITRLEELFRGQVPGVFVLDRGTASYSTSTVGGGVSSEIYARGSSGLGGTPNPIKTYIDGVELFDPAYLGTIDPRSIEKIEIVTGPQAATIYGSGAMGGVMQIFTKRGLRSMTPEINLSVKYGVLENNFSNGWTPEHHDILSLNGGTGPEFSYSGTLSYDYTGQWQPKLRDRRAGVSIGSTLTQGNLKASASFSTSGILRGTWRGSDYGRSKILSGEQGFRQNGENELAIVFSDQVVTSSSQTVALNIDYRMTSAWQHQMTIGRNQNVTILEPVAPNFGGNPVGSDTLYRVNRANGQRLTWSYNTSYLSSVPWMSSSVAIGANGSLYDQVSVDGCLANLTSGTVIGCSGTSVAVNLPLKNQSWGAFGQWRIGLFHRLYTTVGVRMEQNPNYGDEVQFDFTPTNGLTYTFEHGIYSLKLMGSYGRATRPPAPSDRLAVLLVDPQFEPAQRFLRYPNPDLRPEYSRGPQGGFEVYIGNVGSLAVNHYQQTVTDLIQSIVVDSVLQKWIALDWDIVSPIRENRNVAKIRQRGWEGVGSLHLGSLTLNGTYSWNDSRVLEVDQSANAPYQPGQAFLDLPTHTGNMTVSYAHAKTSLTLSTNIIGARVTTGLPGVAQIVLSDRTGYAPYARLKWTNLQGERRRAGYAKTNVSSMHQVTPQITVILNIVNIANDYSSDDRGMNPTIGRQTTLGFSYRFGKR